MAFRASGRNGIGFAGRGAIQHCRREGGHERPWCDVDARTLVCGGRWLSRTEARGFAEGSTGSCSTSLRQVSQRGSRARDGKRNGALSAGGVEWEAGDVDSRTAVGRREHGLLSLAQRRAL